MAEVKPKRIEKIKIHEERSPGYKRWIENGANILKKELPFEGPADLSITVGSGLASVVDLLELQNVRHIAYDDIGLPVGGNPQHKKEIIAGITKNGKKVIIVNGRTHAYEIPEEGVKTKTLGQLGRMELATGYLAMLNEIGVENMILTCAAGGINHPMQNKQERPFKEEDLPVISMIAADLNRAYPSPHMGHYKAKHGDFFGLKDADRDFMSMFKQSMVDTGETGNIPMVYYITSKSTPNFEDSGVIYDAAINGGQVVGMSYSYEKEFISGLDKIGRFMGVAVVTNPVELVYAEPSPYRDGEPVSVNEMRQHRPQEFVIAHKATDKEVGEMGRLAVNRLGKGLVQLIKSL